MNFIKKDLDLISKNQFNWNLIQYSFDHRFKLLKPIANFKHDNFKLFMYNMKAFDDMITLEYINKMLRRVIYNVGDDVYLKSM